LIPAVYIKPRVRDMLLKVSNIMQELKEVKYPIPLSEELVSMMDTLSVLRRLVITGTGLFDKHSFCQHVTDSLIQQGDIESSFLYLFVGNQLECIARSSLLASDNDAPRRWPLDECESVAQQAFETGTLKTSGTRLLADNKGFVLRVSLSYGGSGLATWCFTIRVLTAISPGMINCSSFVQTLLRNR